MPVLFRVKGHVFIMKVLVKSIKCQHSLCVDGRDGREDSDSPIVKCSSGVQAAFNFDHEQREEQEEHGHTKTNTVYSLVANQHITVNVSLHTRNWRAHSSLTKTRNLKQHTEQKLWEVFLRPSRLHRKQWWYPAKHIQSFIKTQSDSPLGHWPAFSGLAETKDSATAPLKEVMGEMVVQLFEGK